MGADQVIGLGWGTAPALQQRRQEMTDYKTGITGGFLPKDPNSANIGLKNLSKTTKTSPNKPQSLEALREKLILLLEEYRYDGGRPLVSGEMDIPSEILLECLEWWAAQPLPEELEGDAYWIEHYNKYHPNGKKEPSEQDLADAVNFAEGFNLALEKIRQQQRDLITKAKKELK